MGHSETGFAEAAKSLTDKKGTSGPLDRVLQIVIVNQVQNEQVVISEYESHHQLLFFLVLISLIVFFFLAKKVKSQKVCNSHKENTPHVFFCTFPYILGVFFHPIEIVLSVLL